MACGLVTNLRRYTRKNVYLKEIGLHAQKKCNQFRLTSQHFWVGSNDHLIRMKTAHFDNKEDIHMSSRNYTIELAMDTI